MQPTLQYARPHRISFCAVPLGLSCPLRSAIDFLVEGGRRSLLEEQNDEWAVGRRYFSTESMNKLYQPTNEEVVKALLDLESA